MSRAPFLPALTARLTAAGYHIAPGKPIPHGEQWLISDITTQIVLNYWPSRGTVQLQGKPSGLRTWLEHVLQELRSTAPAAAALPTPAGHSPPLDAAANGALELGMDESGKGDWYGPLVIAAVALSPAHAAQLRRAGVRDSKLLSRDELAAHATQIRTLLPATHYRLLILQPAEYNRRYDHFQNINLLLADAYAELAAPLVQTLQPQRVICDQFSQRADRLQRAFRQRKLPTPEQLHHAEAASTAVAAASILATRTFAEELLRLGRVAGLRSGLPAGASAVRDLEAAARQIVAAHGSSAMADYAKLNFKPVRRLLGLPIADEPSP